MSNSENEAGHMDGCPLARPWLYGLDEHPLECICADLAADDECPIPPTHDHE